MEDVFWSFLVNVLVHMWILLAFLIVFFFKYIAVVTTEHINDELQSIVQDTVRDQFWSYYQSMTKDQQKAVPWKTLSTQIRRLAQPYATPSPDQRLYNEGLFRETLWALGVFGSIIVMLVIGLKVWGQKDLSLWHILAENVLIFASIGAVEYMFFTAIASQYIPITPDKAAETVKNRLLQRLNQ